MNPSLWALLIRQDAGTFILLFEQSPPGQGGCRLIGSTVLAQTADSEFDLHAYLLGLHGRELVPHSDPVHACALEELGLQRDLYWSVPDHPTTGTFAHEQPLVVLVGSVQAVAHFTRTPRQKDLNALLQAPDHTAPWRRFTLFVARLAIWKRMVWSATRFRTYRLLDPRGGWIVLTLGPGSFVGELAGVGGADTSGLSLRLLGTPVQVRQLPRRRLRRALSMLGRGIRPRDALLLDWSDDAVTSFKVADLDRLPDLT
jgi:hypothetical protein